MQVFESLGLKDKKEREIYKYENRRFYVPADRHIEVHTCVGILCYVLQNIYTVSTAVVGILIILCVWKRVNKSKQ